MTDDTRSKPGLGNSMGARVSNFVKKKNIGNASFEDEIFLPKQAHQLRFQILYLKRKMNKYQIAVHL